MNEVSETINFLGEYLLQEAILVTHDDSEIDISGIIGEISLFEDMFSPTMSGNLVIQDANDLISTLPLLGQERLRLRFKTPTLTTTIQKTFYVYKLHARTSKKRMQQYVLAFCSIELIRSQNLKISKSYNGKISDIVTDIFRNSNQLASDSTLFVEPTKNSYSFISAYWTPIETINWLSNRSLSEQDRVPNYLFFETNQSFEFVSANKLIQSEPIREYVYSDVDANTVYGIGGDMDQKYSIVESIDTNVTFDYLRNLSAGMYSSQLSTFDLTTKNISVTSYDYLDDFSKSKHLEQNPLTTKRLARKKLASLFFLEKNNYLHGNFQKQGQSEFLLQRNSLMRQLSAFKICIKVHGRTDIKVGNTIKLTMPNFKSIDKTDVANETHISDYYQGKYLITAIKHTFVAGKHSMLIEIVSDSFIKPLL